MINGDSLSDTSSSDSPGDVFADPSASPGSVPSRPRSRTSSRRSGRSKRSDPWKGLDEKQRALWSWVNVVDLDGYLQEVGCRHFFVLVRRAASRLIFVRFLQVYEYYTGKGFYCIVLRRMYNLLYAVYLVFLPTLIAT
jgi:autophagy-related protein 9